MTLEFRRRPFLQGNTDTAVESLPFIRGSIRRDGATLAFPLLVFPATLNLELHDGTVGNTYAITFPTASAVINDIITDINAAISVDGHRAYDMSGVVHIEASGGGEGSFVRVLAHVGAGSDAAVAIGLPRFPDPLALVEGGDRSWAPFNLQEQNPPGTSYAAQGEDVTSQVMNRAVDALAYNTDHIHSRLEREIALPMIIDLPAGDPRFVLDVGGNYEQVSLVGLVASFGADYSDRIYLGQGLSNLSTLQKIAEYFAVMDQDAVEIIGAGGDTVRVAAVTHGSRTAALPNFPDEVSPPTTPVPNAVAWNALDRGNVLGQDIVKAGPTVISAVEYRTAVRSAGETFSTKGVGARDKAVIAGALVNTPFNHNGTYDVEQIIDEEFLFLRGLSGARGELNPDDSAALGTVTVSTGGTFADGVFLTFEPPIPAGTAVRLVVGGGYKFGDMPMDQFLRLAIIASEEVDDLVQKIIREMKGPLVDLSLDFTADPFTNGAYAGEADVSMELLWRRITLQGAYDGQGRAGGAGYFVQVDANPPEWNNMTSGAPSAGVLEDTATSGTFLAGNHLRVTGHNFTLDHVGWHARISVVNSGGLRLGSTFVIIDYIDEENVVVEPGEYNPSIPTGGDYDLQLFSDRHDGLPAAMSTHVLQSALYGRLGYVHEEDRIASRQFGHHFLGVRETDYHPSGETLSLVTASFATADEWLTVPFDPTESTNIRALTGDADASWAQSIVRVTGTRYNDGWYQVLELDNANRLRLQNFNGSYPSFTVADNGLAHFYLQTQGYMDARVAANETYRLANLFFEDAKAWQGTMGAGTHEHLGVIGVDWRGASSGLVALINGPTFSAYKSAEHDAASGSVINATTYMPANGVESWHYGAAAGADLSPGGNNPAGAEERGGWAGAFVAETYSMLDGPTWTPAMRGTAMYLAQKGSDSALVAVGWQQGGTHSAVPSPDDLTFVDGKATIVSVREDKYSMMQSGSQELLGAYYQWDPRSFWPEGGNLHQMYGGTYTELPMGSRFSNSPISVANQTRYYTVDASKGTKLSRLGQPGQTLPVSYSSPAFAVILKPPDPARSRSHRSSGFVVWVGTGNQTLREDPASYLGQQVRLDAADNQYDGVYTIINVDIAPELVTPIYWVEVLRDGVTLPEDGGENKAILLGSRWHFANIDLESFAMIGSSQVDTGKSDHSALGALAGVSVLTGDWIAAAARRDYANGTGPISILPGSWTLGLASKTSRHPITNEAWHQMREPLGTGGPAIALTNFETGEWAFRSGGPVNYNIDTRFDESFDGAGVGGAIRIRWSTVGDPGPYTPETLNAYVEVAELQFRRHYSYRVTLRLKHIGVGAPAAGELKTIKAALVDGVGGSLISLEKSFTIAFQPTDEQTVQLLFDSTEMGFDLREEAVDAMEDNGPIVLRLALGHTLPEDYPVSSMELYIFQAAVEDLQKSVVAGHLITTGAAISSGFELHTKALDWKTYGPECAGPYGNIGYGDVRPLVLNSQGIPTPPAIQYIPVAGDGVLAGFLDLMSPSTFWFRGRNDAAFLFLGGKFAPPTLINGAGTGAYDLNNVNARRGGQVGHIVALDPPHGSVLSTLHVAMSIRPATSLLDLNGKSLDWGVIYDVECDVEDKMNPLEGYLIEVWRYSALPTENSPQGHDGTVIGSSEVGTWDDFAGGFSELIHSEVVDLDSTSFVEGAAGVQNDYKCGDVGPTIAQPVRNENFILTKIDLTDPFGAAKNERLLQVDRRQYSYSLVIKAWGVGSIRELNTATIDPTLYPLPFSGGFRWGVRQTGSVGGAPGESIQDAFNSFTRFKFRGATLACRYTRMNP